MNPRWPRWVIPVFVSFAVFSPFALANTARLLFGTANILQYAALQICLNVGAALIAYFAYFLLSLSAKLDGEDDDDDGRRYRQES